MCPVFKEKKMRRFILSVVLVMMVITISCKKENNNNVIIYHALEDFRVEHMQALLKEKFPDYNITFQAMSTGNLAAKLKAEGTKTEADIILAMETSYLELLKDILADLSGYDLSEYLPELLPAHKLYIPEELFSGAIMINRSILENAKLPIPTSYQDLLNPAYKGLISMPNPKTSSTGYMFLVSLINAWGEDAAFAYFDKLSENILQFTSSGSGPVNSLIQGEIGIGLSITYNAINAINNKGFPMEYFFFAEGSPYNSSASAIIKGKINRPVVKEVFDFYLTKLNKEDKELYNPEQIFKNQENRVPNFPEHIPYANMAGIYDLALKERLLAKWKY